jgi:hypothetical protein
VQRATAQSKTGFFLDYGVAEAPPGFQAGWCFCSSKKSSQITMLRIPNNWYIYKEGQEYNKKDNAAFSCFLNYLAFLRPAADRAVEN